MLELTKKTLSNTPMDPEDLILGFFFFAVVDNHEGFSKPALCFVKSIRVSKKCPRNRFRMQKNQCCFLSSQTNTDPKHKFIS